MSEHAARVEEIAALAARRGFQVGVAESLTCGQVAAEIGAGPDASSWFRGGLVAYASEVKFEVLGVSRGPVVTMACARQMAHGAARLLDADAVVATTGVGGPDPEEGEPPGTVFVAALVRGRETCRRLDLAGPPHQVLGQTTAHALDILLEAMAGWVEGTTSGSTTGSTTGTTPGVSARPRPGTPRAAAPAG